MWRVETYKKFFIFVCKKFPHDGLNNIVGQGRTMMSLKGKIDGKFVFDNFETRLKNASVIGFQAVLRDSS